MNEKVKLMEQFGLSADALDFCLDDFSLDELRVKFETLKQKNPGVGPASQTYALSEQFRDELVNTLRAEKIKTEWGEMSKYSYVDHDAELSEVYCYDTGDWNLYGFSYSMNGDSVVIDFDSKKRKKFSIVDFDEGEQTAAFAQVFQEISEQFKHSKEQWEQKYQTEAERFSAAEQELTELRQFKQNAESAAEKVKRDELFSRFEDLKGVEAFEKLRGDCANYSLDDLEEKCFAIRGRTGVAQAKFSHEPKAPKLAVDPKPPVKDANDPYGGVFAEYGITN